MGDETRIYHGRWRNAEYGEEYYAEVALATLPRDRWGALGLYPEGSTRLGKLEGWRWSAPVTLPAEGCRVVLNAEHPELMRVEISDAGFNLLPGYSDSNSGTPQKGSLDCAVAWPSGDLAALGGKQVRIRVHMQRDGASDPRLFAIYLRSDS